MKKVRVPMELDPEIHDDQLQQLSPPELDFEEYREDLSSLGMTAEEEDILLETLWDIMRTMVDIGFGMDAVQMVVPALFEGEDDEPTNKDTK